MILRCNEQLLTELNSSSSNLNSVIPVMYMNHPLFMVLLKEAEKEFGFCHNGPINIPCQVCLAKWTGAGAGAEAGAGAGTGAGAES
ncbi:auxin-responsive protein SAUR32-like protein [Tanacetum coccineum]